MYTNISVLSFNSNDSSKYPLSSVIELNLLQKCMNHYDDYIQLKNESKVQSDPSRNVCAPSTPYVSQLLALPKSGFQKLILISNQHCSTHCNARGLISYRPFLGRKHTISDEKLIISLLFPLLSISNFPVRSLKKYAQLLLLRGDKV